MIRCWIYVEDMLIAIKIRKEKSKMAAAFSGLINRFGGENQEVNFRQDKLEKPIRHLSGNDEKRFIHSSRVKGGYKWR